MGGFKGLKFKIRNGWALRVQVREWLSLKGLSLGKDGLKKLKVWKWSAVKGLSLGMGGLKGFKF